MTVQRQPSLDIRLVEIEDNPASALRPQRATIMLTGWDGAAVFDVTATLEIPLIDGSPWEDVQWDLVRQLHEALNPAHLRL